MWNWVRGPAAHLNQAEPKAKLLSIPRNTGNTRPARRVSPDEMLMDKQTFRDLEIFEAEGGAASVYDLINQTRTDGGSKVLNARLHHPWSSLDRIVAVQQALRFINERRTHFETLPREAVIITVEQYLHSGLPLVSNENRIEFVIESLTIRYAEQREYYPIVNGVDRTSSWLRNLRTFANRKELDGAPGELGPLLEEMRTLLAHPAFDTLPQGPAHALECWQVMRIDKLVRLDEREAVERLMRLIFEMDALVAMADAIRNYGFVMPEAEPGPLKIVAEGVYHPFVIGPVPNDVRVDQKQRLLFITGPNMAGKTTYLRACGIALYLAHLGMGVPARSFRFSPCESLFSAISLTDNIREGVSFFRAEALRVKAIAIALADGRRVAALLDEPFMGTNVKDALDASREILSRLATKQDSVFLVSSHLIEVGEALVETGTVYCCRFEAGESGGRLEFDYILRPGVSSQRLGVRVLEEEGVFALLDQSPASRAATPTITSQPGA